MRICQMSICRLVGPSQLLPFMWCQKKVILTLAFCVRWMECGCHGSEIVDPDRGGRGAAGERKVRICMEGNRGGRAYKKPSRKSPDTCALRAEDICKVRITNKGMQTTIASKIMLSAAMQSRNAE